MDLRTTSRVVTLIVYALFGVSSSLYSTTGEAVDPTVNPTYDVTLDIFFTLTWEEQEENDEGSSLARFVALATGFVVFLVAGIFGVILVKARRTMAGEEDPLSPRFVQEKVEDIRDTTSRLLPGKNEKQTKEETEQQDV